MLKNALTHAAIACAGIFCSANAYAVSLPAENASGVVLHSTLGSVTGEIADPVGEVKPGQTITITGDCVSRAGSADNLQVVLTFADTGTDSPGYRSMIATDQEIEGAGLSVRVPDLPAASDRVFSVKVFRLGQDSPQICNAGSIKIGRTTGGKFG